MLLNSLTGFGAGGPRLIAPGVDFDGSAARLARGADLTGNADSSQGIFSAWLRLDGGNASQLQLYFATGATVSIHRNASNQFFFSLTNAGGTAGLSFRTAGTYTAGASWLHLLASWDTNFSAGNKLSHLYVNDVSDKAVVSDAGAAFNVDYTVADHEIGAQSGGTYFNGCLGQFYFAPGQFLDLSNSANRRKFITADLKPEFLGDTGAAPTGTAPKVLLAREAANFGANAGTGGNFTVTGTLTPASSYPSG